MAEDTEGILKERKEKFLSFFKNNQNLIFYFLLIIIILLGGIYLRTLNIQELKDTTTNSWTLAPDLDPFLFLRWARDIANNSLMKTDTLRYYPLGFNTADELMLPSYLIAYLYKFSHLFFPSINVEYAAIIYPVIFFCLTLIAFFLFVRKAFSNYKNANLIALISTAFVSVIPGFVHRTVAGVPEKESAGIFFMFLAFYFIACAFKAEKIKKSALLGLLAGVSTALMGLVWGGVTFNFVVIALTAFLIFFFSEIKTKDILAYAAWIIGFTTLLLPSPRYGLGLFTSVTSGIAYFVLALLLVNLALFNTNLKEKLGLNRIKIPEKIISLVSLTALAFAFILIFEPSLLSHMINDITNYLIKPFATDRFTLTVAENNRPFFDSWKGAFGISLFWIFVFGSVLLVYELFGKLKLKQRLIVTGFYFLMIIGMIFSRYSESSIMNGTSTQSLVIFLGSIALFFITLASVYIKEKEFDFDRNLLLIFAVFFFAVFSARAAIRLFYFIYPIAPIMAAFILVRIPEIAFDIKDELEKIILLAIAGLIIVLSLIALYNFAQASQAEVKYATVPGHYQFQWQSAMGWVRDNTAKDAVFAHWWDYGYWVQTMGERPTIVDGGNAIVYWDHLLGRHVLTAENETEALEFLKTHDASYLLIDSTDIGKYTAYSSIGADENYDRYSWISTFSLDEQASQEKRNETIYVFRGGAMLDKDMIWEGQIYPEGEAGIGAVLLPLKKVKDENYSLGTLGQPSVILIYQGKQVNAPIKCIYVEGKRIDFDEGISGCFYIFPEISQDKVIKLGAGFWLSEKLMNSLMVKLYILNESENFEIAHIENEPILDELNSNYNLNLPEMIFYDRAGLLGPIKIWKINYPKNIKENPDYLKTEYPKKELWEVKR